MPSRREPIYSGIAGGRLRRYGSIGSWYRQAGDAFGLRISFGFPRPVKSSCYFTGRVSASRFGSRNSLTTSGKLTSFLSSAASNTCRGQIVHHFPSFQAQTSSRSILTSSTLVCMDCRGAGLNKPLAARTAAGYRGKRAGKQRTDGGGFSTGTDARADFRPGFLGKDDSIRGKSKGTTLPNRCRLGCGRCALCRDRGQCCGGVGFSRG